jgi:hypothetical protein
MPLNCNRFSLWNRGDLARNFGLSRAQFDDFPWFQDASVDALSRIEEPAPGHFYWPDLDVDLGLETIRHPERFPLKSRVP